MASLLGNRWAHYLFLVFIAGMLFLPNLGSHSLWDVDEAHNAVCAREMLAAETYIVPTFNYRLRTDKPPLQYWCVMFFYQVLGVNEFAARLGSALCGIGSVLLTYELGRRMFDCYTGFFAGVVLATSFLFGFSSHAVTPDAFLILLTMASFLIFWRGYTSGSNNWLIAFGLTTGLAVLAKGPVGLVLPFVTNGLFLVWERRWRALFDWRLILGCALFAVVACPWYIRVALETKWQFWHGFFLKHNLQRFQTPLEGHHGPFFYHPLVLLATFAPWSCFLGLTVWQSTGRRARQDSTPGTEAATLPAPYRFLWCWIAVWFVFFSIASSKLPNYILPCFPALAILTARILMRWRRGTIAVPRWFMVSGLCCTALVGVVVGTGMVVTSGRLELIALEGRQIPELLPWALSGVLPILAAVWAWRALVRDQRGRVLAILGGYAVVFVALLGACGPAVVDGHKVTRDFAQAMHDWHTEREIRIGCYDYYQPGLVFYTQRKVEVFHKEIEAIDHLHSPLQAFLILPAGRWEAMQHLLERPADVVARKRDFFTGQDLVVVANRMELLAARDPIRD